MNDTTACDRNDTGILSLADLFRHDRLPCRAEPRRWPQANPAVMPTGRESRLSSPETPNHPARP